MIIHVPIELGENEDCLVGPGHPTQPCGLLFGGAKKKFSCRKHQSSRELHGSKWKNPDLTP